MLNLTLTFSYDLSLFAHARARAPRYIVLYECASQYVEQRTTNVHEECVRAYQTRSFISERACALFAIWGV